MNTTVTSNTYNENIKPVAPMPVYKELLKELRKHTLAANKEDKVSNYFVAPAHLKKYYALIKLAGLKLDSEDKIEKTPGSTEFVQAANTIADGATSDMQKSTDEKVQTIKNQTDVSAVKEKLRKMRQDTLDKSADSINATFDKADETVDAYPENANSILSAAGLLSKFYTGIGDVLKNFGGIIMDAINKVIDAIKNVAIKVEKFFSDAASKVGHFFSSLF